MRVLVYPHDLDMGGSQMNAIELAAAVRDLGVETMIFGRPGTLNQRIDELGLEFVLAPQSRRRPSPTIVGALRRIAADRGVSILHGYEWPPSLECYIAAAASRSTIAISTVMSMSVAPFIPRTMPLLVGTEQIADTERSAGRPTTCVLEPPIDLMFNAPLPDIDVRSFRHAHGIDLDDFTLVCVGRLAYELKAEGLLSAIAAVAQFPPEWRVRLIIVGDGPARDDILKAVGAANQRAGRTVVTSTGQLMDPRPAYAAADAVIGMGGSALRGLAYSKPLIVQGEQGFFSLLDERTAPTFMWQGWYGIGTNASDGLAEFSRITQRLVLDRDLCHRLGMMGRKLVEDRFSLTAAAVRQIDVYERSKRNSASTAGRFAGGARALPSYLKYQGARKMRRARGKAVSDDFNKRPVAATPATKHRPALTR